MGSKKIQSNISLNDNISVQIDIEINLNKRLEEINDDVDKFVTKNIIAQELRSLKSSIETYKESELPNVFLNNQKFIVTDKLPFQIFGYFYLPNDDIVLDADTVSNIRSVGANFLFGHEMGHKIAKYRNTKISYKEIASIYGLSIYGNERFFSEVFADICGYIVSPNIEIDQETTDRAEYLKRKVLKDIYKF